MMALIEEAIKWVRITKNGTAPLETGQLKIHDDDAVVIIVVYGSYSLMGLPASTSFIKRMRPVK
jgi:hypothetical protein